MSRPADPPFSWTKESPAPGASSTNRGVILRVSVIREGWLVTGGLAESRSPRRSARVVRGREARADTGSWSVDGGAGIVGEPRPVVEAPPSAAHRAASKDRPRRAASRASSSACDSGVVEPSNRAYSWRVRSISGIERRSLSASRELPASRSSSASRSRAGPSAGSTSIRSLRARRSASRSCR